MCPIVYASRKRELGSDRRETGLLCLADELGAGTEIGFSLRETRRSESGLMLFTEKPQCTETHLNVCELESVQVN